MFGFVDHGFSGFGLKVFDVGYSVGHCGWHAMVVTLVVGGELGLLGFWVGLGWVALVLGVLLRFWSRIFVPSMRWWW